MLGFRVAVRETGVVGMMRGAMITGASMLMHCSVTMRRGVRRALRHIVLVVAMSTVVGRSGTTVIDGLAQAVGAKFAVGERVRDRGENQAYHIGGGHNDRRANSHFLGQPDQHSLWSRALGSQQRLGRKRQFVPKHLVINHLAIMAVARQYAKRRSQERGANSL